MLPLTESAVRSSFVNCSRGEASRLTLPEGFADLDWDRRDLLGWADPKAPLRAYVVLDGADGPVGLALRTVERAHGRRRTLCAWCEDVFATNDVGLFVAPRAGAAGRRGDSVGTLVCTGFECAGNVLRAPRPEETADDAGTFVARRRDGLRERALKFVDEVLASA